MTINKDFFTKIFINHFSNVTPFEENDKILISELLKYKYFKKNEFFLKDGDSGNFIGFVAKGAARSFYIDSSGNDISFYFTLEGNWIGSFESFFSSVPSEINIEFLEDSDVLILDNQEYQKLVSDNKNIEKYFRVYFRDLFIHYANIVKLDLHAQSKDKYINFINIYPEENKKIPQKHIASFLGMTPEFLSKIKKDLDK
jgi:CRP-like cAMP-binding protein